MATPKQIPALAIPVYVVDGPAAGEAGAPGGPVQSVQGVSGGQPVPVAGVLATPSASFTRPADTAPYAAGDLVANSTTAGSVTPMSWTVALAAGGTFSIAAARIRSSSTSLTNASYRVHLYASAPTPSNGDNGTWLTDDVADYLGAIDVTLDRAFTDGSFGVGTPIGRPYIHTDLPSGTTVRGLVEARAARTPASGEVITVTLEVLQNS